MVVPRHYRTTDPHRRRHIHRNPLHNELFIEVQVRERSRIRHAAAVGRGNCLLRAPVKENEKVLRRVSRT